MKEIRENVIQPYLVENELEGGDVKKGHIKLDPIVAKMVGHDQGQVIVKKDMVFKNLPTQL